MSEYEKWELMDNRYNSEKLAERYFNGRPTYPSNWFSKLAALTRHHSLACDFGTGNGQAALAIAKHYDKVIGIDSSKAQLKRAKQHERVKYINASTSIADDEMLKLIGVENEHAVDLIISAEAVHYFDLPRFYSHATRLLRNPGGIIAVWGYKTLSIAVSSAFDAVMKRFGETTLPYWNSQSKKYIQNGYKNLPFPFESVGLGCEGKPLELELKMEVSFDGILRYINSMSSVCKAREEGVELLTDKMVNEFKEAWGGNVHFVRTVKFEAFMLAGKVKNNLTI